MPQCLTKDKEYAGDDPGLKCIEAVRLGRVGGDGIENIDKNKK